MMNSSSMLPYHPFCLDLRWRWWWWWWWSVFIHILLSKGWKRIDLNEGFWLRNSFSRFVPPRRKFDWNANDSLTQLGKREIPSYSFIRERAILHLSAAPDEVVARNSTSAQITVSWQTDQHCSTVSFQWITSKSITQYLVEGLNSRNSNIPYNNNNSNPCFKASLRNFLIKWTSFLGMNTTT